MTRAKSVLFYGAGFLVCVATAGGVGGAVAAALVTQFFNRPSGADVYEGVTVDSDVLGESVLLRVRLPAVYRSDSETRYPVLWVLDGPSLDGMFLQTTEAVSSLGQGQPMIVVGVPSSSRGRSSDFIPPGEAFAPNSGRADRFWEFLEGEALPAIEREFRTDSVRVIAGHSLGGVFVTYGFVRRPQLFDGWLAFSPSWWLGDQASLAELDDFLSGRDGPTPFFYASLGGLEGGRMRESFDAGVAVLEGGGPSGFRWGADITVGADHITNPGLSAAVALRQFWTTRD